MGDWEQNQCARRHGGIAAHPRPWRVIIAEGGECGGVADANGEYVIVTDNGYYPPDAETAEFIVRAASAFREQQDE